MKKDNKNLEKFVTAVANGDNVEASKHLEIELKKKCQEKIKKVLRDA